ncbi:MAG: hypothetical protein KY459_05975 [Acidobacteria bacterium]|nr:hypothetical protein [Acidobacteriota bacterium]
MLTADAGWLVMAAPLLLALAVVGADMVSGPGKREALVPSRGALLLAITFVLAGFIVALRDPALVKVLIPVIGAGSWVTILLRSEDGRRTCRWI